jgi:hypothetical protein
LGGKDAELLERSKHREVGGSGGVFRLGLVEERGRRRWVEGDFLQR